MRVRFEEQVCKSENTIEGIDFDIKASKVWIQIQDKYVCLELSELKRMLKMLD